MTVDIHVHMGSFPSLEDAGEFLTTRADVAGFRTKHPDLYRRFNDEDPLDNSSKRLAVMNRHGIDVSLIQPRPGVSNDLVAQMCEGEPRLRQLALPTPWPTERDRLRSDVGAMRADAVSELRRCLDSFDVVGVGELYVGRLTQAETSGAISDDLAPIMEIAENSGLAVQIPTAWTQFPGGLIYGDSLWVDELAYRYPTVPIVLTKMGRGMTRFFDACMAVAIRNDNVYFDVSNTNAAHLGQAIRMLGAGRIMYGSDWSATWQYLSDPLDVHGTVSVLLDEVDVSSADRKAILRDTAMRIYRLAEINTPGPRTTDI